MSHSSKPPLSVELGASHLHAMLRADDIRRDTLVQLVHHWAEPKDRDAIIDALDELAAVASGVAREGELDAAVEQVEDVAGMETAHIEVDIFDVRRLRAEIEAVERVTSRFQTRGASLIKHPTHAATRAYLKTHPLPKRDRRRST